jgi:hypothetical protein
MDWLQRAGSDISEVYQYEIVDPHKQPQLVLLVSFLVTFAVVRFVTHSIRAGRF